MDDASGTRHAVPLAEHGLRAPARVVHSLVEADALRPGEVLVAETTAPSWTPLFATAAAVVTDTGGILSHCAIVARECNIPAVVGVGAATAAIRTGQIIEVDGDNGLVRIPEWSGRRPASGSGASARWS